MPKEFTFKSTEEIQVSKALVDQVIGQEEAVEIIKKAAQQRRHVLLIGDPGTGKSLLGLALAELLPKEKLVDVLCFPNVNDENQPLIRTAPAGKGRDLVFKAKLQNMNVSKTQNIVLLILAFIISLIPYYFYSKNIFPFDNPVIYAASMITGVIFILGAIFMINMSKRINMAGKALSPKVIVDNYSRKIAPFFDATGAHAGALLGDVLHDPLQCILGDEFVYLPNGKPIPIKELVDPYFKENEEGQKVALFKILTGNDNFKCFTETEVQKVFRKSINEDIVKIKTRKGYTLSMSKNHPVAIFSKAGKIEYIPAGSLQNGTFAIVPYKIPICVEKKLNKNLLLFLADSLVDGYFGKRNVIFKIRTPFKRENIEKDISNLGYTLRMIRRGMNIEITLNSADFLRKLRNLGVQKNNKKQIPQCIFDLSEEQIKVFLTRYISMDGYVNYQGQFELISKELIHDITALLLKIGIKAKLVPRIDTGFGKEKKIVQPRIRFNDSDFAKFYEEHTINPIHKNNLRIYLKLTKESHVRYDDIIPINFKFLENIRKRTGLSKTAVHKSYYALSEHTTKTTKLTRQFLSKVLKVFTLKTNCPALSELKQTAEGTYAYDEIVEIVLEKYAGHVYNLTTSEGTYLANFILTHNSGGLGTPPHERVIAGMIHKAHMGVLFVDEISTLHPIMQQELLTALQEGKYSITGQSERSSGAMVRTEPVPCDFVLVAAGNVETMQHMHPALRSRIRGYGYEIFMRDIMLDTPENRLKVARFIAQEVRKDKKIPHFSRDASETIIEEARRMANTKGHLTLRFRELGGLVRAAGDLALEEKSSLVEKKHIWQAKKLARPLEQQIADKFIERKKEYEIIVTEGKRVGRVNGLAVLGGGGTFSGIVLPIESEVTPGGKEKEIVATGKLGEIAKEAVKNVSAIIKKYFGEDIKKYDIYVQFLQTYEGVEGDSASIAVATSIISALKKIPVKQYTAMTGSLSVRGEVMPIGGVSAKIEAAIEAKIKQVIIPRSNLKDIIVDKQKLKSIKIIPVDTIVQVLKEALDWKGKERVLNLILTNK